MGQVIATTSPAAFGLLGVVLGLYFNHRTTIRTREAADRAERQKELRAGLQSTRLTALELRYNSTVLNDACDKGVWWSNESVHPGIEAWWEYRLELSMRLPGALWKTLAASCTELHTEMWKPGDAQGVALTGADKERLRSEAARAAAAADALEDVAARWETASRYVTDSSTWAERAA